MHMIGMYDNIIMYVRSRLFVSDAGDRVISCSIQVMISVRRCLPGTYCMKRENQWTVFEY